MRRRVAFTAKRGSVEPQRFGKYELVKFLGGGMSEVYVARDTLIDRTVVVKILSEAGAQDEGTRARFIREAQLAGSVIHENIIRVYDFGEQAGRLFMVMELLQGDDLSNAIRNKAVGGVENRLRIAEQITRAMEHIHSLQIVHRDLKPQNVFISSAGVAKLMDFGIAKTDQTSLTQAGYSLGTPSYMAPEQVLGNRVNHLADIYSFGILLFELITETKPLAGDTLERVFWKILHEPVDLSPMKQMGAPDAVVALVERCTRKDPAQRPQSFEEVRRTLNGVLNGDAAPVPTSPPIQRTPETSKPAPKNKRWLLIGIFGGSVALLALGVYLFEHRKAAPAAVAHPVAAPPAPTLTFPAGDMVLIPAGAFLFGEKKETRSTLAYYIDHTEVSNAAFSEFVKRTGYPAPSGFRNARPDYPVVNITIKDAREFARWAGKRLPVAIEWEKAARGTDGRRYPWGDEPRTNVAVRGGINLHAVSEDSGASPNGVLDMAGNVWEFIDEPVSPSEGAIKAFAHLSPRATKDEPWCTIRGGSYLDPLTEVYEFGAVPERLRAKDIGFRCVRDLK
jgi:serine/threonine protein kinase